MFFRRPKLTLGADSSSYALLQEALARYHIRLGEHEGKRQLQSLNMDDIDSIGAIEMVEKALHSRIDRKAIGPLTTNADVVTMFDAGRR